MCLFSDGPESVAIQPAKPLGVKDKAVVLNCSADGNPPPSYEWQLPQHQPRAGQSLQLSNIQFEDGGMYTCVVKNTISAGEKTANRSVELRVEGKLLPCTLKGNEIFMHLLLPLPIPTVGPPQKCNKPSVVSYEGCTISVNVSCENDGNSVITEYEVQQNTTPSGDWKSVKFGASSDCPFLVQDLMPFTYYDIRVRAANKYKYEEGDVSFSDPVSVKTAEGGKRS